MKAFLAVNRVISRRSGLSVSSLAQRSFSTEALGATPLVFPEKAKNNPMSETFFKFIDSLENGDMEGARNMLPNLKKISTFTRVAAIEEIHMMWLNAKMTSKDSSVSLENLQKIRDALTALTQADWTNLPSRRHMTILSRASVLLHDSPAISLADLESRMERAFGFTPAGCIDVPESDAEAFPFAHQAEGGKTDEEILTILTGEASPAAPLWSGAFEWSAFTRYGGLPMDLELEKAAKLGLELPSLREQWEARMFAALAAKYFQVGQFEAAMEAALHAYEAESRSGALSQGALSTFKHSFKSRALLEDLLHALVMEPAAMEVNLVERMRSEMAQLRWETDEAVGENTVHTHMILFNGRRRYNKGGGIPRLRTGAAGVWKAGNPNWKPFTAPVGWNKYRPFEWAWSKEFFDAPFMRENATKAVGEMMTGGVYKHPRFQL